MTLYLLVLLGSAVLAIPAVRLARGASAWILPLPMGFVFVSLIRRFGAVTEGNVAREVLARVEPLGVELALRLDGLGLLFSMLVSLIGAFVLVHAAGYFREKPGVLGRFAAYAYLFAASMVGLVLADDLVVMFIAWELTSVCSFLLIGLKHEDAKARSGAQRALIVTGLGGIALLVGVLLLAQAGGTTSISLLLDRGDLVRESALYLPSLGLIFLAAFTKSAQAPFHYWLPGAMAAPGPVSAFLHSATLVKAGVFLLLRLHPVLGFRPEWHVILGHAGAITLLLGAVLAFSQDDLKRMLAYTTTAGLGMLVLLLGIGTEPALRAALLFAGVHALYKAGLFLVVGYLDQRTGTRDVKVLAGLARTAPVAFLAVLLAALSMSGLPPLLGAIAKELVYEAKLGAPEAPRILAGVGTIGNALVISCALMVTCLPFLRRGEPPALRPVAGKRLLLGPLVLSITGLFLGIFHDTHAAPLIDAALGVVRGEPETPESLLDASPSIVSWLGKATLALGVVAFVLRRRILALFSGLAALGRRGPTVAHDRLLAGVFSLGEGIAKLAGLRVVRQSLLVGLCLFVAIGIFLAIEEARDWNLPDFSLEPVQGLLLLLVAGGVVATLRSRSSLGAVTALGISGFGVGMLFLVLGGPDLAMTQIAVETLAVLLLLAVLGKSTFEPTTRRWGREIRDVLLATAVGLTFMLLVWVAAPDGSLRPLARELAESSQPLGHGRNVVNVILVDFRALDTLGEIFVLAVAALGVSALLTGNRDDAGGEPDIPEPSSPGGSPILRAAARSITPLLALLSIFLFARGHHEPGGGFVGGLVAGAAALFHGLAFGIRSTRSRLVPARWIGAGLAVALLAGAIGLLRGEAFLEPAWLAGKVPAVGKLGTPLLFDAGVFLVVLGVSTQVLFDLLEGRGESR